MFARDYTKNTTISPPDRTKTCEANDATHCSIMREASNQICHLIDQARQESKAKIRKMAEHIAKRTGQLTRAEIELQGVRQEMVEEIEKSSIFNTLSYHCRLEIWQELKRKWGVK